MNPRKATVSLSVFVSTLLLATGLTAQTTTTIKTSTAFGTAAAAGTATGRDSKPLGTAITRTSPLRVTARAGGGYSSGSVYAYGNGVSVYDYASVYISKTSTTTTDSAGTTTGATGNIGDAHAVSANIGEKEGTRGQMVISWSPYITGKGVALKAVVNVDGNDVATFTQADAGQTKRVDVTVGKTGIAMTITTSGSAAPGAAGSRSYYSASVRAYFQANVLSSACTFTKFDKGCGMDIAGSALTRIYSTGTFHDVTLAVTGLDKDEAGLLAVGDKLTTGVTLPAGGCTLLVDPVVIVAVRSSTRVLFRNPGAVSTNMQSVAFKLTSKGITISSSNGLTVACPKL